MPEKILTDGQMELLKNEIESGKRLPQALKSAGLQGVGMRGARQQMVAKYGQDEFRAMMASGRPIPDFERLASSILVLESRLTSIDQVNTMASNLTLALKEIIRIRDNLSS